MFLKKQFVFVFNIIVLFCFYGFCDAKVADGGVFDAIAISDSKNFDSKNSNSQDNEAIAKQIDAYFRRIYCIVSDFVQKADGRVSYGCFVMLKKSVNFLKIINYDLKQKIYVDGKRVIISDLEDNVKYRCSVARFPFYYVFMNGRDIADVGFVVIENTFKILKVKLAGAMKITLIFSKYSKTGNIKKLEGWTIDDKSETSFFFVPETFFVNAPEKIIDKINDSRNK